MHIRFASLDDIKKLAENNVQLALESEGINIEYENTFKGVKEVIGDKSKGFYLVAEENEEIIGQLMVTYEWSDWRAKQIWWLQSIYVRKEWRRKGVMKALIEKVKNMAMKEGVAALRLYVHKENRNAIKAYEKVGMRKASYLIYETKL